MWCEFLLATGRSVRFSITLLVASLNVCLELARHCTNLSVPGGWRQTEPHLDMIDNVLQDLDKLLYVISSVLRNLEFSMM